MDLKALVEEAYISDTNNDSYVIDSKGKKKSKHHAQNETIMKENLSLQMLNTHEFITKSIGNKEDNLLNPYLKDNIDTPVLELTTEKNNIDTENTNIVNINSDVTETPEMKRNFSFRSSKILNTSGSNINKIEEMKKSSSNKSINTIVNSHSGSRLFFEESKMRSVLAEINYDNIKRAPANGNVF